MPEFFVSTKTADDAADYTAELVTDAVTKRFKHLDTDGSDEVYRQVYTDVKSFLETLKVQVPD
jgi:hypothetical protein